MIRLITKKDLANKLNLSVEWVEQAIIKGLVPSPIELDGHVRWNEEIIDKWIRAGCPKIEQQEQHFLSDRLNDGNKTLRDFEKEAIIDTLHATKGNRLEAARRLEIGERTLYRKIKELDLNV